MKWGHCGPEAGFEGLEMKRMISLIFNLSPGHSFRIQSETGPNPSDLPGVVYRFSQFFGALVSLSSERTHWIRCEGLEVGPFELDL
jgi:hypothetical protein